jgi:hypothetical protein
MNTLLEMRTALKSDLNVSDNSSLYPQATLDLALNRSYIKVGGLFKWTALEDSLKTSTAVNQQYYEYPDAWKQNSVWRLEIDGELYGDTDGSPMNFNDFLIWKSNNPNSTDKKWANQWKRYFVTPTPTTAGTNNITIWGYKNVETLTNDIDTTIFSYDMPECNDGIVMEAGAILKKKGEDGQTGRVMSAEAKEIWTNAFNRIKGEQAKYENTKPFFEVPDYFSGRNTKSRNIGNF